MLPEKDSTIHLMSLMFSETGKGITVSLSLFWMTFSSVRKDTSSQKFKNEIDEIRVEGHTSSEWNGAIQRKDRFIKNVELQKEHFQF